MNKHLRFSEKSNRAKRDKKPIAFSYTLSYSSKLLFR